MPHFKDAQNNLYWLDAGADPAIWLPQCTPITDAEADAIRAAQTPAPTQAQIIASYEDAVQAHLDAFAATWRYESILSAASYANSTVAQFKAEALAMIAWRDAVWNSCYTTLAAVQAGTQPMPASPAAFIATLPMDPARP